MVRRHDPKGMIFDRVGHRSSSALVRLSMNKTCKLDRNVRMYRHRAIDSTECAQGVLKITSQGSSRLTLACCRGRAWLAADAVAALA